MYLRKTTPYNFGGLEGQTFKKAKAIVLPAPYEGTVSYGSGASKGPKAIIEASRHMELYDLELDGEPWQKGIYTEKDLPVKKLKPEKMIKVIEKKYSSLIAKGKFVAMLGGEHSISSAVINPLKKKYGNFSVLQWDAHADLRNYYEGTPFSHACVARRFYEQRVRLIQVAVRSMSKEEADFIRKNKLRANIFTPLEFNVGKILKRLTKNVYITIDMDGFDPAVVSAVGTPEPGGLFWRDFLNLTRAVFNEKNVIGFDAVELSPIKNQPASDFLAALLIYKMIGYKFNS